MGDFETGKEPTKVGQLGVRRSNGTKTYKEYSILEYSIVEYSMVANSIV